MRKLCDWLLAHAAGEAVVGVEGPAGYGRLRVAALEAAGQEVLNLPAWRRPRQRRPHGPVRALALLELPGRRLVRDRSQAIQRLRADRNHVDPVGEARVVNLSRHRELRRRRRSSFAAGLGEHVASRCSRELAREIQDLKRRLGSLDAERAQLLAQHGKPSADLQGAGTHIAAAVIAQAGELRRFRKAAACARFCGAAPLPCGSGQTAGRHRLQRGGNRQLNAARERIAILQARHHPPART